MKHLLKITSVTLMLSILALTGFASIEPVLAQAATDDGGTTVNLNVDAAISITSSATTTTNMSTSINLTTSSAIATTTWTVKTNSSGGYLLTLASGTTSAPAMKQPTDNTKRLNDFVGSSVATGNAPQLWSTATSNSAEFGYSALGTHAVNVSSDKFAATGVVSCGATSTPSTALKYAPLVSTANTIASHTSTTTTAGVDTTVCWAAAQNGTFYIASGSYQASAIATATTQ